FVDALEFSEAFEDPLLGATFAGRFTILARLGRGSMGSVYRARQEAVGRDVAIKIVRSDRAYDTETKTRFEREARAVSLLTSPHTVTAFDFGEAEDGSWFLVMEMLEGETLGERLKRVGRLPWREAARFVRHALLSLAEAHQKGIIHRDLKPDNLFISHIVGEGSRESCKILDFGIAKWMDGEKSPIDALETQAGTVFGTPRYMSPEQAQGAQLDARSDLYSLGVLFYQMLTGRAPFVDDDAVVVMARHIKDPPPKLSEVAADVEIPASIERVLRRTLAKAPAERPQSAEEFAVTLDAALDEAGSAASGVHVARGPESQPARAGKRVSRWSVLALAVLLLSALVWAGSAISRRNPARPAVEPIRPEPRPAAVRFEQPPAPVDNKEGAAAARENSTDLSDGAPVPNAAASAAGTLIKRSAPRRVTPGPAPKLERKGNERYGRFE
ncbi:MAG TPA: protein kinase, partial [Polyangiaceae bacterium]|nr:protein kinase [Polyangiaceae bacterium]